MLDMAFEISVNGKPVALEDASSVTALLQRLDLAGAPCAVEVNRRLVPRADHASFGLSEGDEVEIVTLVGGG